MAKLIIKDEKRATNDRNIQFVNENYEYKKGDVTKLNVLIHPPYMLYKSVC